LKPDVVLICDEPNDQYITSTPEIVVEIISQSSAKRDEVFKFEIYEREKVPY
jgi:Uma2 family endonuclease